MMRLSQESKDTLLVVTGAASLLALGIIIGRNATKQGQRLGVLPARGWNTVPPKSILDIFSREFNKKEDVKMPYGYVRYMVRDF